jgi:hypothetical protein
VLKNGDRDGELEQAQAGERHAKRAARDDKTGPQCLKSEVRAGGTCWMSVIGCGCMWMYVACVSGHGLNAMRCGVIQ